MNELYNTSKTNWLELEADPAKTTNAAIEEHQKIMAQHFERAIAEARRMEDVRYKNINRLGELIGKGIKTAKDIQEWKDKESIIDAEQKEIDSTPEQVKPEEGDTKPKEDKEDKEKKQEDAINKEKAQLDQFRNTEVLASEKGDPDAFNDQDTIDILKDTNVDKIKRTWGDASLYFDQNYHTFMREAENKAVQLEGHPLNEAEGSEGAWTIRQAEALGGPLGRKIAYDLRRFYKKAFLSTPAMKGLPKRLYRKIVSRMVEYDKADRASKVAALKQASVERHIENRRNDLNACLTDSSIECIVGTKDNPNSGHVWLNQGRPDGSKDNAQGWKVTLADLEYLGLNGHISWQKIEAIKQGLVPLRGEGGKEVYLNQVKNLEVYENKIGDIAAKVRENENKKLAAKKKTLVTSTNNEAVAKLLQDKADGVKIDNEYMDNVLTQMEKTLQDAGIPITKEELRSIPNSIDKFNTFEEMSDEDITEHIDKLIKNNVSIPNSETMLVQIDDRELYKQYTKKVSEHKERLALVTTKDVKDFNSHLLPSINKVLQVTQATTVKTVLKDNIIRNSEKLWKAKVLEYVDKHGIAGAKKLATDEILADMKNAIDEGRDLPDVYTEHVPYTIDTNLQLRTKATESFIKITPNALTIKEPWPIETPEVIQQGKDYLAGTAPPPLEYILMSNEYPDHTYHSLIETRVGVDPKKGEKGEGKVSESIESEELNNHTAFTGKGATHSTVHRAINSNDINQVLKIARKTDDVNSLLHANLDSTLASPLERLGFDRPLSELSVDEIRGLVNDDSFHGFSDSKFGLFSIPGNQLKTILERENIDGDRLFDEDLQNELAIHNIRYKANQANSLSTVRPDNTRLTNISRGEQEEFLKIMGILSGDEDSENLKNTVEYQFLNSPFNQLDVLIPAVQSEVIQKDPSKSTNIDWKGVGWPFVGIYQGMNERNKQQVKEIREEGERIKEGWKKKEEMFPTK
jgi:hypothetical protein